MIRWVAVLIMLSAGALRAEVAGQMYPALHAVVGVAESDVLNIRATPDDGAEVVGTLAPNQMGVEVIRVTDGWAEVNTGEVTGYAALRFLARQEGPDWYALAQPLSCFGTEPFWSLALDPDARNVTFSTPEITTARQDPISQTWPGAPWAQNAAINLPEGLAVLSPADCSDGMSEQSYGISIDLFLTAGDRQRLSGCCTLALR
jgi:uncharacterized membrane protein